MSQSFVRTEILVYLANKTRYIYKKKTKKTKKKKKLANLEKVMNARMLKVLQRHVVACHHVRVSHGHPKSLLD